MEDNKYIKKDVDEILMKDGWTMETLATAQVDALTLYKGIGSYTARKIINEARRLVNERRLEEAASHVPPPEPPEEPAMSVRVRRLRKLNQQ